MFTESVHCQLGVAQGSRKVDPRSRTGYCEWSVAEGVVATLYDADGSFRWSEWLPSGFSNELAIVGKILHAAPGLIVIGMPGLPACTERAWRTGSQCIVGLSDIGCIAYTTYIGRMDGGLRVTANAFNRLKPVFQHSWSQDARLSITRRLLPAKAVAETITSTHRTYPRSDGQAECAWVACKIPAW